MSRRRPYRHNVRAHDRGNSQVQQYERGDGYPRSQRHVVVKRIEKPERILNIGDKEIIILGDIDDNAQQGLDLWIEMHRFETKLLEDPHVDYDVARVLLSQVNDHLHNNRHRFTPDINISQVYRQADVGVVHRDFEEVSIGFTGLKRELENCHKYSWKVKEE